MYDILLAAGSFAAGVAVGVVGLSLFSPENPDLGPFVFVVYAISLAISPVVYMLGFLFQEAALPPRSRRVQVISASSAGVAYVLVLRVAMALGDLVGRFLELPKWLGGGVLIALWLLGPAVIAIIAIWVERRLARRPTIEVGDAS